MKTEPTKIKDAKLQKLLSEAARNEAEQKKFLCEANEIDKRANEGIFSPSLIIKSLFAGIVTAGLMVAWTIGYIKPILDKNNTLTNSLDSKIDSTNRKQAINNQIFLTTLQNHNDSLRHQQTEWVKLIQEQINWLGSISDNYQNLSRKKINSDRTAIIFTNLSNEVKSQAALLNQSLKKIISAQNLFNNETRISDSLISCWLIENKWTIENFGKGSDAGKSFIKFFPDGTFKTNRPGDNHWKTKEGTVTFNFSNYAKYYAKISGKKPDSITGNSLNIKKESWVWRLTIDRIPIPSQ